MAIETISNCQRWHNEYCDLVRELRKLWHAGVPASDEVFDHILDRMNPLSRKLGYLPLLID